MGVRSILGKVLVIWRTEGFRTLLSKAGRFLRRKLLWKLQQYRITRWGYYRLFDSNQYWEERYAEGHPSGPGSTGEHARFKADFINTFIREHDVSTVVEFGCGDGTQVELGEYPSYVGLDVSEAVIDRCEERFAENPSHEFRVYNPFEFDDHNELDADLVLSLEVLFHLVNDDIYEKTLTDIFKTADKYVIIFSSDRDEYAEDIHIRHRKFSDDVRGSFPEFELIDYKENPFEERVSDFYVYERTV